MKRTIVFTFLSVLVGGVVAFGGPIEADAGSGRCGPLAIYDFALPKSVQNSEAAGATEIVVLRYIPGDTTVETEYRIVLRLDASGHIRASRTEADGLSIQSQMRQLLKSGELPCKMVVERLKLKSNDFEDQSVLKRILRDLHRLRLDARLAAEFYLDAPRYEIAVESGMNEMSWRLYGPSDSPMIAWFKRTSAALRTPAPSPSRR